MREQRLDELRYSEVAVVLVQVTFDQPGRDVQAARVDRARIGPLGVRHVADSRDPVALDGHVGEVELSGGDVDDGPAFDDEICGRLAHRDVDQLSAPCHSCLLWTTAIALISSLSLGSTRRLTSTHVLAGKSPRK